MPNSILSNKSISLRKEPLSTWTDPSPAPFQLWKWYRMVNNKHRSDKLGGRTHRYLSDQLEYARKLDLDQGEICRRSHGPYYCLHSVRLVALQRYRPLERKPFSHQIIIERWKARTYNGHSWLRICERHWGWSIHVHCTKSHELSFALYWIPWIRIWTYGKLISTPSGMPCKTSKKDGMETRFRKRTPKNTGSWRAVHKTTAAVYDILVRRSMILANFYINSAASERWEISSSELSIVLWWSWFDQGSKDSSLIPSLFSPLGVELRWWLEGRLVMLLVTD